MTRWNSLAAGLAAILGAGRAGHSQELATVHPSFAYSDVMPSGFDPAGIGDLDFLGDDGVVCTWGGSQRTAGEVVPAFRLRVDGRSKRAPGTW